MQTNETKKENEWQDKATAAAIAAARKIAGGSAPLLNTPVGRLNDAQWGWIVTAAIFGWIRTRCEQAIEEGLDQEQAVRITGLSPSPCDVAVVHSILPGLADQAGIDWSLPLSAWPKDTMVNFLLLAWELITKTEARAIMDPARCYANRKTGRRRATSSLSSCKVRHDLAALAWRGSDQVAEMGAEKFAAPIWPTVREPA
jgi:hypothetical protein